MATVLTHPTATIPNTLGALTAHTLSRDLLASMNPRPVGSSLTVPELVERLTATRAENIRLDELAQRAPAGSREEAALGDQMSALDDREYILTIAIKAAVDLALEPLGLTHDRLIELNL